MLRAIVVIGFALGMGCLTAGSAAAQPQRGFGPAIGGELTPPVRGTGPTVQLPPLVVPDFFLSCETGSDLDRDGLDDGEERCWLSKHAPVLYLPLNKDWVLPANVDWYLARTTLRFHHNNCSDDQILPFGSVNQATLVTQKHQPKRGAVSWNPCSHTGTLIRSRNGVWNDDQHFFLQGTDATHEGSTNPADWIVYGHVYPNDVGGVNVQYWFFYPYNDNFGSFNHEGDWETIVVQLGADLAPDGVFFCGHGSCDWFRATEFVTWYQSSHPTVWVADGSHASYPGEWECDNAPAWAEGPGGNSCETDEDNRWFTWAGGRGTAIGIQGGGVINVGELTRPLNKQHFISYSGQWGENGVTDTTSGPRSPSFQSTWDHGRG